MSPHGAGGGFELMYTWTMLLALSVGLLLLFFHDLTGSITGVAGCLAMTSPL